MDKTKLLTLLQEGLAHTVFWGDSETCRENIRAAIKLLEDEPEPKVLAEGWFHLNHKGIPVFHVREPNYQVDRRVRIVPAPERVEVPDDAQD